MMSKEEMRLRFWALKKAIDEAEAKIADLRAEYEPGWNAAAAQRKKEAAEIRAIEGSVGEEGLSMYDAKMELAFYGRGLGNVGDDPDLAAAPAEEA